MCYKVGELELKTLSDKSREAKVKGKPRTAPRLPKYSAGLELLSRYEDAWAALHRRAKECADAGELVDSEVVMLSAHWEKKRTSLNELQGQLQQLPALLQDLESLMASLAHLETSFEEVENHLLHLEDLCGQCELERHKQAQAQHLESYKKSKRKELEAFKEAGDSHVCLLKPSESSGNQKAQHIFFGGKPSQLLAAASLPLFSISEDAREGSCLVTGVPLDQRASARLLSS